MAFDFTNKVDPKASRAIYLQLLDMIQGQIQDKSLKPGDMLPSEKEFCQYYHISRTTVRLTFRELEQQGLIIRRRGLGTFISEPKVSRRLGSLYSFTEDMKKLSYKHVVEWLIQAGFLQLGYDERGKKIRQPTENGVSLGINIEHRRSQNGPYTVTVYDRLAQKFILDNLDAVIELGAR